MAAQTITSTVAAARASRATTAVGAAGIAASLFVVSREFVSWQVAGARPHTVSMLGGRLSYPTANAAAIGVLGLALLGATVVAVAIVAAVGELRAARRLDAWLARSALRVHAGAHVIARREPHAFSAGLLRPRVYITTGALERLDEAALAAVLEHERVDRLLGDDDPPAWTFPTALFLVPLSVSALLAGIAAFGSRLASGRATLALPLLSRRPCVIVLALVPGGVAFLGLRAVGRMRAAWLAASSRDDFRGPRSIA